MPDRDDAPTPPRSPQGYEDRPGRSGPDVGDDLGGQGAEFAGDAVTGGGGGDDPAGEDAGASYLRAIGEDPAGR